MAATLFPETIGEQTRKEPTRFTVVGGDETPVTSLDLRLTVTDRETIADLEQFATPREQTEFALSALRIGVLALRQARGRVDVDLIQRETARMLGDLAAHLTQHSEQVKQHLATSLKDYFDPESGRFNERVKRLVEKDGELERVLRSQVGNQDSELCKTLVSYVGQASPLMKLLSPNESEGLFSALKQTVGEQLAKQSEVVLGQFSLDNKESALSRLIGELEDGHGKLTDKLEKNIEGVVKQFSLDDEDSALSRLCRNVERAQKTISSEFSLDNEQSALSRMSNLLDNTTKAIHGNLTLDDENSALFRLKRELVGLFEKHAKDNTEFQTEVKVTLASLNARKEESKRSTMHGVAFEAAVGELLAQLCTSAGDCFAATGQTTGIIKNSKVGDFVIELSADSAASGGKIVVEAKEKAGYSLPDAREEIETARNNRQASVGLFVFSKQTAPPGINDLSRHGDDVFVVWNVEDAASDLIVRTGLTLARALCLRAGKQSQADAADFKAIDAAIEEINKQTDNLDDVRKSADTIQSAAVKILERVRISREKLEKQIETLREKIGELKQSVLVQ